MHSDICQKTVISLVVRLNNTIAAVSMRQVRTHTQTTATDSQHQTFAVPMVHLQFGVSFRRALEILCHSTEDLHRGLHLC